MKFKLFGNSLTRLIELASQYLSILCVKLFGKGYFIHFYCDEYYDPDKVIQIGIKNKNDKGIFVDVDCQGGMQILKLERGIWKFADNCIEVHGLYLRVEPELVNPRYKIKPHIVDGYRLSLLNKKYNRFNDDTLYERDLNSLIKVYSKAQGMKL